MEDWTKNKGFLTAFATVTKKDPTTSIRKHANELKVHERLWGQQLNKIKAQTLTPLITLYGAF